MAQALLAWLDRPQDESGWQAGPLFSGRGKGYFFLCGAFSPY